MVTECDLLQISQITNWGKIYRTIYPFGIHDPRLPDYEIGVIYADQLGIPRTEMLE
jgi:hypothetical protein